MAFDSSEIADMFSDLSSAETHGFDQLTYAGLYHTQRWAEYEEERRRLAEVDPGFAAHEKRRRKRANSNRRARRHGHHLGNRERVLAVDTGERPEELNKKVDLRQLVLEGVA